MVLLSLLEARDILGPKAAAASIVVGLAALQFLTMAVIYGWLPSTPTLKQRLRPFHLWEGRILLTLVLIVAALCVITWGPSARNTRVLAHTVLGVTVVATLIFKVTVVRYMPSLSRIIPVLGSGLLASFIAIWFLTAYWYWFTDGSDYSGSAPASVVVKIVDAQGAPGQFATPDVTIKVGDVVEWVQESGRQHTVSGESFDSGPNGLSTGESFKFQFNRAGKFSYICNFHPSMRGTVTVTAPGGS